MGNKMCAGEKEPQDYRQSITSQRTMQKKPIITSSNNAPQQPTQKTETQEQGKQLVFSSSNQLTAQEQQSIQAKQFKQQGKKVEKEDLFGLNPPKQQTLYVDESKVVDKNDYNQQIDENFQKRQEELKQQQKLYQQQRQETLFGYEQPKQAIVMMAE